MRICRFDRSYLTAAMIIFLGGLVRFALVALGWPAAYNDEGTMGLMARHIAYQGAHPLLYYGQDYLGPQEAYLGAIFFHLFGPSTFSLRLGLVLLFIGFLWCMYLLIRLLYNQAQALFMLMMLSFASADVMLRQLIASGVETNPLFWTALLLLLTCHIALTAHPRSGRAGETEHDQQDGLARHDRRLPWLRLVLYAAWGGVAGVTLWSHLLFLPFVVCAACLLFCACRQELRFPVLSLLLVCFLIGLSPLLIYKITVPVSSQENSIFAGIVGGGYREPSYPPIKGVGTVRANISPKPIPSALGLQILGTLLVALPTSTNGAVICPVAPNAIWPLTDHSSPSTLLCTGAHGAWSLILLLLGGIATVSTIKQLWLSRITVPGHEDSIARYERVRWAGQLMLLAGGGLTLLAFMLYPQAAAITPLISARYLAGLLLALPAVIAPLLSTRLLLKPMDGWRARLRISVRFLLLMLLLLVVLLGSVGIFVQEVPPARAGDQKQQMLIARLLQANDTRIYADYEDCNRISFLSNEQVICAALDKGLHPGLDRCFPYRAIVAQAPRSAYVLQKGSVQAFLFEQKATNLHIAYRQFEVSGYIVYEPEQPISP